MSPAHALQVLDARDGVAVEAILSIKEATRIRKAEARAANVDAAHRALAMRRAANFTSHPAAGQTANEGMTARPNRRRKTIVSGSRIGSVSQATKVAQAVRDKKR